MKETYITALQKIRNPQDATYKLFETDWQYQNFKKHKPANVGANNQEQAKIAEMKPISEKDQIIVSLSEYANDKFDKTDEEEIHFNGGKVVAKKAEASCWQQSKLTSVTSIEAQIKKASDEGYFNQRFQLKQLSELNSPKVMFITDSYIDTLNADEDYGDLSAFFEPRVCELFSKMIKAMGLGEKDYYIETIQTKTVDTGQYRNCLAAQIAILKPKFIVTLGAQATTHLLDSAQRLKNIHGKFFDFSLADGEDVFFCNKVFPLFSPKLLHTAPNMKKTTWKDMQKLMELF